VFCKNNTLVKKKHFELEAEGT